MDGGVAHIYENTFYHNGYLSFDKVQGNPEALTLLGDFSTKLPYTRYAIEELQSNGVFLFDYNKNSL